MALAVRTDPLEIPIDPSGNLTRKTEGTDVRGYEWNADDQLKRVTENGVEQARFAHDPNGRRVETVAGGVMTSCTYDGEDILRPVRGGASFKYAFGPGIDQPLAADDGTALTYIHADALGSIVKMTSAAGAVALTRQYEAWESLQTGAEQPGYAFTGREWDPEVGLYYYRARYSAIGLSLRRASAGPTAPRLNGRRHCARSVGTDESGLVPAPAPAPWLLFG